MEEQKSKSITLVVILSLVIVGLIGYIVYDKFLSKEAKDATNNVIEKTSSEEIEEDPKVIENDYQIYSESFRKEFSKFDTYNHSYLFLKNEYIPDGYSITLNEMGSLYVVYINSELNRKYGEFKIADNVLSFYSISTGQDSGNTLYFIKDDGTVGSAETEYGAIDSDGTIVIDNDLGYKNIVTIMAGTFGDDFAGGTGPIFVDINGKIFSELLKK